MPLTLDSLRTIAGYLRTLCVLALVALFAHEGRADTLAYWNNDLTAGTTRGGWTLSAGTGARILEGTATNDVQTSGVGHEGLVLERSAPSASDTLTLVVKYSGLLVDPLNGEWALASFFGGDSPESSYESVLYSRGQFCWMSNRLQQEVEVARFLLVPPSSGLMAVVFSRSTGTRVLFQDAESSSFQSFQRMNSSGFHQNVMNAKGLSRIQIGGCSSDISDADGAELRFCRPSMTIEGVAILDKEIFADSTYDFPPYVEEKPSLTPYYLMSRVGTPVWNDVQLEDLLKGTLTARINGAAISSAHKDEVLTAMSVKAVRAGDSLAKVECQFQLKDEDAARAVFVECTSLPNGNFSARVQKIAQAEVGRYGEDASSWTEIPDETFIRDETSPNFGLHDLKLLLPYGRVVTISSPTRWMETGIKEDETGEQTLVQVEKGATITFSNSSIPSSIHFDAKAPAQEIEVDWLLPALTAHCPLVVPPNTMVRTYPEYTGTVIVRGRLLMLDLDRVEGVLPSLVLDGGTLADERSDLDFVATEETTISLEADATIDCAHAFSGRQSASEKIPLAFNGHTLTKTGKGRFLLDGVSLASGGTINVQEGVVELRNVGVPLGTSVPLTVSVEDGADLSFSGSMGVATRLLPINLVKGSFTATEWNLNVTVPAGSTLVRHLEEGLIRYTFADLTPRTEPGTVTAMDWFFEGFTIGEGEDAVETLLIPGDTVVFPATLPDEGSIYANRMWPKYTNLKGHPIIACQNLPWDMDVTRLTIADGVRVTLKHPGAALVDGAFVDGAGTLEVSGEEVQVSGNVTVSCPIAGTGALVFTAGSTLTSAPIAGVRLVSAVEGERVSYDEEKGQYRLVSKGLPLEPGQTLTVKAGSAAAAAEQAYPNLTDADAVRYGQEALLRIAAKETAEGSGVWTLSVEIDETKILPLDEMLCAFAKNAFPLFTRLGGDAPVPVLLKGTPGLYYSLEMASDVAFTHDRVRTPRVLCTDAGIFLLEVPARTGKAAFFKLLAHITKE